MPKRLGIDETSFQKRHEYVTVVTDMDAGRVIDVVDDRKKAPLEAVLNKLGKPVLSELECIAMDMHKPFIEAVKEVVLEAGAKIAFDKFHVIAQLKAWRKWLKDARDSLLTPIEQVAKMISGHLQGILVAMMKKVTNARGESMNNKIQHIKKIAYGFRNRERFKNAIFFHLGGLDLYPATR